MVDDPENITLRYLRRLDEKTDRLIESVKDLATDVRGVKGHMASFMQNEIAQDSGLASIRERLDRIERRLDLRD